MAVSAQIDMIGPRWPIKGANALLGHFRQRFQVEVTIFLFQATARAPRTSSRSSNWLQRRPMKVKRPVIGLASSL